ncbi:MAG: hypothetical protein IPQ07_33065 [Myxococcales bacterium]|nr:hypothetical protein [Myxococcales bacterium]
MEKARTDYGAAGERGGSRSPSFDFEIAWCATFPPKGPSEAELRDAVAKAVAALPAKDPKIGKIIGAIDEGVRRSRLMRSAHEEAADELLA